MKNEKTHKLTNIELVEDDGQYYLSVEYLIEDENRIEKVTIPRVEVPFNSKTFPEFKETYDEECWEISTFGQRIACPPRTYWTIKTGYGNTAKISRLNGISYTVEIIKEKEHEMTIEEIEKKLGYKVKIVSGDKKRK